MESNSSAQLILTIDQGTTSSKVGILDDKGQKLLFFKGKDHEQITQHEGWLEHDPMEIMNNINELIADICKMVTENGYTLDQIKACGVTNQRETTVAWNPKTGKPYNNAIVWCDTRTKDIADKWIEQYGQNHFKQTVGLPINTYFSGFKIRWLIENVQGITDAKPEDVVFGNIDAWIIFNLTNGKSFSTDCTNASRTFLMNLKTLQWDDEILKTFGLQKFQLPQIRSCSEDYGSIEAPEIAKGVTICGVLGDQQAASLGHALFTPGTVKNTYGTGCFMIMNIGTDPVVTEKGLLSTVLFKLGKDCETVYGFEGAIECGAQNINWLKKNFQLFETFEEMTDLAKNVEDTSKVIFVPTFSGIFSPYWNTKLTGTVLGLTLQSKKDNLIRATLEGICFRNRDVTNCMEQVSGKKISKMRVDGGVTNNQWLMQLQADILGTQIEMPAITDSTSLGAGFAAGLYAGIWKDTKEIETLVQLKGHVNPNMERKKVYDEKYQYWDKMVNYLLKQ